MKKLFITSFLAFSLILPTISGVYAREPRLGFLNDDTNGGTNPAQITRGEERGENRPNILNNIKNGLKNLGFGVHISGSLTAINGSTLTVSTQNNGSVTVNILANTQIRRRFWGKTTLSEFSTGDNVQVIGSWTDGNKTAINAVLVRDVSIEARWGVLFGTVTVNNSTTLTVNTFSRGTVTVDLSGSTKLVNRNQQTITVGDIQVGNKVRIKGIYDLTSKVVVTTDEVKDFSIPAQGSLTPTVAPTATPTLTPTPTP